MWLFLAAVCTADRSCIRPFIICSSHKKLQLDMQTKIHKKAVKIDI